MNYPQVLEYLYSQLPLFQRIGASAYKKDLNNTIAMCKILGNPEKKFESIHIAGTNGKGSVSHFLASILQSNGLKVGLYTSPHLKDFRERIRLNGRMIPKANVIDFVKKIKSQFQDIQPSFFEYTFGMAASFFAEENVDIAVVETGMGGRLDSTNVIDPIITVITNIGLDHTQFLGETLVEIAKEKAGIIKPGIPIIIGESQETVKNVFIKKAKESVSPIIFADQKFKVQFSRSQNDINTELKLNIYSEENLIIKNLKCDVTGHYQEKNIVTLLRIIYCLNNIGYNISVSDIRNGLESVVKQTGLSGRWQILDHKPLTICDTGHNEDGIKAILSQIEDTKYQKLHFVIGLVKDKNIEKILRLLPKTATYYFCKANIPRGLNQQELRKAALKQELSGNSYNSVSDAFVSAKNNAKKNDLIFIGGSTFVVAEVL